MSTQLRKRGRPKGTGLDDRRHLLAIAVLISQSEELKPTTAIKSLGIDNPSVIRRLRDKFNSQKEELMAEVQLSDIPEIGDNGDDNDVTLKNISAAITRLQKTRRDSAEQERACLLKMKSDPAVRSPLTTPVDTPQKKSSVAAKSKTDTAHCENNKTTAQNPENKPQANGSEMMNSYYPKNDAINGNLFTAWLNFCTEFANCTAQAQLQFMRTLTAPTAVTHPNEIQRRAFELWLHAVPPKVPSFLLDEA